MTGPLEAGVGMAGGPATLGVQLAVGPGDDAEQVAEATLRLRRELLYLDVEAVELPHGGEPPPGTRGVDLAALGALAVSFAQSQMLGTIVATVRSWLASPSSAASSWSWTATSWS